MKKVVGVFLLGMFLFSFMLASAEWVGTESKFTNSGEDGSLPTMSSLDSVVDSSGNYWFWAGLVVLVLIVGIVYFRKVNKGKVSKKGKRK